MTQQPAHTSMTTYNADGTTTDWIPKPNLPGNASISKEEFRVLGLKIFGRGREYGWKTHMQDITGTPVSTINKWAGGKNPIPPFVGWMLRTLDKLL